MSTKKSGLLVVTATVMLSLLASACNSDPSGAGGDVSDAKKDKTEGSGPKVTLEYFQQKQEVVKVVDELIKKFEQENPNIEIKQNNVPNAGSVWQMRISTNDVPPLSTQLPHNPVFRQAVANGYMADLSKEPFMQRVDPNLLKQNVEIGGQSYLVPIALATLGVYYNVDVFEKLNIAIPTTYNELLQAAEKIKATGMTPFLFPDKSLGAVRQESEARLGLDVPNAPELFTDVLNGKAHITDHAGVRRWAEKMVELRKYGQPDTVGLSSDDAVREFANGKSAMYFQGIWSIVPMKQNNPNLKFDLFPFPADQANDTKVAIIVDTALGLSSSAKHPNEAKKFIDFMSSPEHVQAYVDATQYPSAIQGVQNNVKEINRLWELIHTGKTYPFVEAVFPKVSLRDDLAQAVQKLIVTKDVDGFLQGLDSAFYNKANQ